MGVPSIAMIVKKLEVSEAFAHIVRGELLWANNVPLRHRAEAQIKALDNIVQHSTRWDGYGETSECFCDRLPLTVEHIRAGRNKQSPEFTYIDVGDTYGRTICLVDERFVILPWGSIVEMGNYE